ncbi:MAG: hypothetical protein IJ323_00715 [Clostridia bacterium]|nr:hypothetical protein [Clostridia bacterium]
MKYLTRKHITVLLTASFIVEVAIYLIPVFLQSMVLQRIITILYIVAGTALGAVFFAVNGASTAIIDGEYEKNYIKALREGKAKDEGENFHWNPLKLSLAKRIYYSKITLCFLVPILAIFFMEYVLLLISQFMD